MDFCAYCHGPDVPNRAFNPADPDMRGLYYVKANVDMLGFGWAEFNTIVRSGVHPELDMSWRRRYMPPFDQQSLTDDELLSIAQWLCGQYPDDLPIPPTAYCNELP